MAGKIGIKSIPEVLNGFNVYDHDGGKLIGISDSVTLAPLSMLTATISGAGIGGEYAAPVIGHTQSMQQEIPFRTLYHDITKFVDHSKVTGVTLRGAIQVTDPSTGVTDYSQVRVVVRGKTLEINPGGAKSGEAFNASMKLEVLYMLIEVDGEKLIEHDKLNEIFVVNNEDIMDKVRRLC